MNPVQIGTGKVSLVEVFKAIVDVDERGPSKCIGYFSTKQAAEEYSKGKGWYGGNGWAESCRALMIELPTETLFYTVVDMSPTDLDLKKATADTARKIELLASMSADDKRILGIKG